MIFFQNLFGQRKMAVKRLVAQVTKQNIDSTFELILRSLNVCLFFSGPNWILANEKLCLSLVDDFEPAENNKSMWFSLNSNLTKSIKLPILKKDPPPLQLSQLLSCRSRGQKGLMHFYHLTCSEPQLGRCFEMNELSS